MSITSEQIKASLKKNEKAILDVLPGAAKADFDKELKNAAAPKQLSAKQVSEAIKQELKFHLCVDESTAELGDLTCPAAPPVPSKKEQATAEAAALEATGWKG